MIFASVQNMSYFGVGPELIIPMRFGVHLAAATWIFGASGATRARVTSLSGGPS